MSITSIIAFILILGVLVIVHEIGHFAAARIFKIGVDEFGIGFPPRITGKKIGKTLYSLNWIPVGGFVKIKGVVGGDQMDTVPNGNSGKKGHHSDDFSARPIWQRFAVLFAGIFMNLVLAAGLLSVGLMLGTPASTIDLPAGATVENPEVVVIGVAEIATAREEGITEGDAIVSVNGYTIDKITDIHIAMETAVADTPVVVDVRRSANEVIELDITPTPIEDSSLGLGVYLTETGIVTLPVGAAIIEGTTQTGLITLAIFSALGDLVTSAFGGEQEVAASVAGPIGIASLTHDAVQLGVGSLLQFAALLSINLAIFNLLPIPALDGGRLMFVAAEGILRKPVNQKVEAVIHNVGFVLLLLMIFVVTVKDVLSLF